MLKLQHSLLIAIAAGLAACGETSSLQVSDGTGPNPKLCLLYTSPSPRDS